MGQSKNFREFQEGPQNLQYWTKHHKKSLRKWRLFGDLKGFTANKPEITMWAFMKEDSGDVRKQHKGNYGEESWYHVPKYSKHFNSRNTVSCYLRTLEKPYACAQVYTAPLQTAATDSSSLLAQQLAKLPKCNTLQLHYHVTLVLKKTSGVIEEEVDKSTTL